MKRLLLFLPLIFILPSCSENDKLSPDDTRTPLDLSVLKHEQIILGEQLEDPYSLENVNAALKSLYPTKASRIDIRETNLYVRFKPSSDEQFVQLESMGVQLIDHPLDFEIVQDGDYYVDPTLADGEIAWQYAVVPANFSFPPGIRYETLHKCYIAENDISTRAGDGIDWAAVERESYRLTGNSSMLPPVTKAGDDSMEAFQPTGRITIVDDSLPSDQEIGVAGIKVSVNSFVKFASAYTDAQGYYTIDKKYSSDVRYKLVFHNTKGFSMGVNLLLVNSSVSTLGKHSPEGVDVCLDKSSDRKMFCRCVVNNAAYDYFTRCTMEDSSVTAPPQNLRFWLFMNLSRSMPLMMQQGAVIESDLVSGYLGEYGELIKVFLPDITLGLKGKDDYASIYSAAIHELSHSSHYMQAGSSFWNKLLLHELKSWAANMGLPFGSGAESTAGYCEVAEMWSYYFQNDLYRERYGFLNLVEGTSYWFYPQVFLYLDDRGIGEDLIFRALTSSVVSRSQLQSSLVNLYPEYKTLIDQAFERYE